MSHDFHPLTIAQVRQETPEALSLALRVPDAQAADFRFKPGQHLVLRRMLDGAEVRRTYSISSGPGDRDLWITIKKVDGGLFSTHAHAAMKAGDSLDVMAPSGRFVLPPGDGGPRTLVAIVAGSGITPVMAMVRQALEAEPETRFAILYGNRSLDSIIFRQALEDLKDRFLDRLMLVHVLSRDPDTDVPDLSGRIDADKITRLLGSLVKIDDVAHFFLCGPDTLIKTSRDTLMALGVPRGRIHFEFFRAGSEPEVPRARPKAVRAEENAKGAQVTVTLDGSRQTFRVPEGMHVVDAALAAGVRVPYSCKGGMCCTCRAKVMSGKVEMTRNFSLEPWEIEAGFVLTCQAVALTPDVVLDYDQV